MHAKGIVSLIARYDKIQRWLFRRDIHTVRPTEEAAACTAQLLHDLSKPLGIVGVESKIRDTTSFKDHDRGRFEFCVLIDPRKRGQWEVDTP